MAKKEYRVNVYENQYDLDGDVIARVRYNQDLDFWNGRNWQNGGMGRHKGITKLKDGRYVLIHGTDWQGEKDWAEIISPEQALQEILKSGNHNLLETKKFRELKELYEKQMVAEEEDDLEEEEEEEK
jgi:hypothetical protein